jgi:hypothetical protein
MKTYDIEEALALVSWIQRRNHRAYLSHKKKKIEFIASHVSL